MSKTKWIDLPHNHEDKMAAYDKAFYLMRRGYTTETDVDSLAEKLYNTKNQKQTKKIK